MSRERSAGRGGAEVASARARRWPTEPPVWLPLAVCVVIVAGPLAALSILAPAEGYLARLLWGNPIDVLILWAFAGTVLYLAMKRASLRRELSATEHLAREVLPVALEQQGPESTPADVHDALERELLRLRPDARDNLLLARCRFLALFARSAPNGLTDGTTVEQAIGPLDRDRMHASYAFPRFMVWAIPILGFIGTVWGISDAVASFSHAMASVEDAAALTEELQRSLPGVTSGLSVAFDTTFVALVVSLPLVLLMTRLEKREDNYLAELDELWLSTVAPRIATRARPIQEPERAPAPSGGEVADELRLLAHQIRALHDIMQDMHQDAVVSAHRNVQ